MSHFCLGVICRNGTESDIAKLLAPFSVEGDEFQKFHSITENIRKNMKK